MKNEFEKKEVWLNSYPIFLWLVSEPLVGLIDSKIASYIDIDGFGFESQIIHQVSKKAITYKEMPTNTIYTNYSKNKGQRLLNGLIILEDLFKSRSKK